MPSAISSSIVNGATVSPRTREALAERLRPARRVFGGFTLAELEGAAADIARWRAGLPDTSRYRLTQAFRQALAAAIRWRYMVRDPAVEAGRNPEPRSEELEPFSRDEIDALAVELGPLYGPLVVFCAETGLRTNEWTALERRDRRSPRPGRHGPAPLLRWRADPVPEDGPPPRAAHAARHGRLDSLPARLDTTLVFPASRGGYIALDNWRTREWYSALEAAAIRKRGPYRLRLTFATEALAAGVSIFQLARLMGASVKMIDRTYGHLAHDSEDHLRQLLAGRSGVEVATTGG